MAGLTVIYVDTLFLLNAIVDYLLLLCSARLAGERLSRLRFALGALLGAEDFGGAGSLCHGWSALPVYYLSKLL